MKKFISALLILLAITLTSSAQTRETRNVPDFDRISYGLPGKLFFTQGSPQKVELVGDKDLLEKIETTVEGDRLILRREGKWFDWSWDDDDDLKVYITAPTIEALSVSGSGDALGQNLIKADELDLKVSGSGNLTVEFDATGDVTANVSGSGDINLKGKSADFSSSVSGSGKVLASSLQADDCVFDISGSGRIEAKGTSHSVKVQISGSGKIMGSNFQTDQCTVKISGSGDVAISVKEELDVNVSGSGSVSYRGNPNRVNSHSSGSGSVRRLSDIN